MTLENFRKVRIELDHVNKPTFKKIVAKEGDWNGRELEVQIINGHQFENLANATVTLYWKHLALGNSGNKNFEAVDRSKGVFKVAYPEAMLSAGNVLAHIAITVPGRNIPNVNFIIKVEGSGFDAVAAVASNDFQALNEALLQVKQYQAEIDGIKADLRNQGQSLIGQERAKFEQLFNEIRPQMDGLEKQFNDAMANLTQDSEVISGRTSTVTGDSYSSIGKRLDEMEVMTVLENQKAYFEIEDGRPRLRLEEF